MKKTNLLLAVMFIGSAAFSQSKLSLTKGQTFNVESKMSTETVTEMQGQEMKSDMEITTNYKIEVADANKGNYTLNNTVTGMKFKMSQMGQEMKYDSDDSDNANNPLALGMDKLLNTPHKVRINESGKITGYDTVDVENVALTSLEQSGFGAEVAFQAMPANLKAGDKWSDSSTTPELSRKTNYVVKSIAGDLVTLGLSGTLKTDIKMENQGIDIHTVSDGTFTGETVVDRKTGIIHSSKTVSDAKGTVNAMGQEFPVQTKVESSSKLK